MVDDRSFRRAACSIEWYAWLVKLPFRDKRAPVSQAAAISESENLPLFLLAKIDTSIGGLTTTPLWLALDREGIACQRDNLQEHPDDDSERQISQNVNYTPAFRRCRWIPSLSEHAA